MIIKDSESVDIHTSTVPMRTYLYQPATEGRCPDLVLFGRIAMIATLLAGYVLGLSGAETIEWLDRHQPGAGFMPSQTYGGG
jgi:hypothetical protein